jgi:hypothetical protein
MGRVTEAHAALGSAGEEVPTPTSPTSLVLFLLPATEEMLVEILEGVYIRVRGYRDGIKSLCEEIHTGLTYVFY